MSSSRGRVTERSLSRVRLYDLARVAQPVVSSFFNAHSSLCMRAPVRARERLFTDDTPNTYTRNTHARVHASTDDSEWPARTIGKYCNYINYVNSPAS